jgi:hypothetical protein
MFYCAERYFEYKQIFLCNITFQSTFVIRKSIIIIIVINCKWICTLCQCDTMQDGDIKYSTVQYSTVQFNIKQYNTIKHITQNNIQHSRQPSIHTTTKKKLRTQIIAY